MKTIHFRAMGCKMNATVFSSSTAAVNKLNQVPDWFEEWEQILSRFRPDSELSLFNQKFGRVDSISPVFQSVLRTANQMEYESDGLVTPKILNQLEKIGYDRSFDMIKQSQSNFGNANSLRSVIIMEDRSFPTENNTVQYDFGGVAKGWAAHQAMQRLEGYAPTLVNAGGDIAISALMPDGKGWIIKITDPFDHEKNAAELRVGRGGVATSGIDYRIWQQGDHLRHHIIDPRTGYPAETDLISVTVIAPTVMDAEMASKTILILGGEEGLKWLRLHSSFAGFLIYKNGEVKISETLVQDLRWSI